MVLRSFAAFVAVSWRLHVLLLLPLLLVIKCICVQQSQQQQRKRETKNRLKRYSRAGEQESRRAAAAAVVGVMEGGDGGVAHRRAVAKGGASSALTSSISFWPFLEFAYFMPQCIIFQFINLLTAQNTNGTHQKAKRTEVKNVQIGNENANKKTNSNNIK